MPALKRFYPIDIARILRPLALPLFALLFFTAIGLWTIRPPAPSSKDGDFSVDRAVEHLRQIAREPHPVGSPAHGRALAYLVDQLRALPFDVQLQDAVAGNLRLTNVLARQKNPPGSNVVLLVAHYDSVGTGPGAGDDGAGVATLLETARLIAAAPPTKNEIAFLFTDGEEQPGLPGSGMFIRNNAAFLKRVKVVLNFEARGNRGPVLMFETGRNNLELIRLLRACPYPAATSFAQDVYRRMPNDTDFSQFLAAGFTGYNFALIMGFEAYHRPADDWQSLSRRSLAHFGSYAVTLGRRLAQMDLDSLTAPQDAVFFPPLRGVLAVYPASWARSLAIAACVLYAIAVFAACRRHQLRVGRVLLGILLTVAIVAVGAFANIGGLKLLHGLFASQGKNLYLHNTNSHIITIMFMSVTVLAVLALKGWLSRNIGSREMLAGALPVWLTLAVLTASKLTGFSYLPLWPALFGIAAMAILMRTNGAAGLSAMLCTVVPACLLFAPVMVLAYHALGIELLPVLAGLLILQILLIHVPDAEARA